jgi:hypothetical protein
MSGRCQGVEYEAGSRAAARMYVGTVWAFRFGIFPFQFPIKEARAGFPVAPVIFIFCFQTTKLEGLNPANFEVYVFILISGLEGIEWFYRLDKIFRESRILGFLPCFGRSDLRS